MVVDYPVKLPFGISTILLGFNSLCLKVENMVLKYMIKAFS